MLCPNAPQVSRMNMRNQDDFFMILKIWVFCIAVRVSGSTDTSMLWKIYKGSENEWDSQGRSCGYLGIGMGKDLCSDRTRVLFSNFRVTFSI